MKVLFTGARGSLGKLYCDMYPDTHKLYVRQDDQGSMQELAREMIGANVLIHAGANLRPKSIEEAIKDNTFLPLKILEMAHKVNPDLHLIFISSMSLLDESCKPKEIKDMNYYAASKYLMEQLCGDGGINPLTIVRFSTLFYGDPEKDGLSKIVWSAKTHGRVVAADCRRDFIPLDIACKWLHKLCHNKKWYNRTINLASGHYVNMLDVAKFLVKKYDVSFHHTTLPVFAHICYRFDARDAHNLEPITFDLYKLIEEYYNKL